MQRLFSALSFIILCNSLSAQCLNSENDFREYFKKNINNLDPIEGIWSTSYTAKKYQNGSFTDSRTSQNISTRAVIMDAGKYKSCNMNNEYEYFTVTWSKTAVPGMYIYNKKTESGAYSANAVITGGGVLEYSYELNKADIREHFITLAAQHGDVLSKAVLNYGVDITDIVYEYTLVKLYPSVDDYRSSEKSSGTGFGISSNGIIVTNFHVIDGASTIKVRGINGDFSQGLNAKVLVTDPNNDLALIQIDDYKFTSLSTSIPFKINASQIGVGEDIFVLGYPLRATMGDEIKLTNGIISSKSGFQGDITVYQISAPVQPGSSGGPVFDSFGNLTGIVNAKHAGAENASYAIKSSYLLNLVENLSTAPKLQTVNKLSGMTLTSQVETIKKYVYIIEVN